MRTTTGTMRLATAAVLVTSLLVLGCGGGGGGGGPAPTVLGRFEATLLGTNELAVEDPEARSFGLVQLRSDGQLSFVLAAQAAWVGDVTGLHIHSGAAGVNGAIRVDLLSDGATFDPTTHVVQDTFMIPAVLAAQIAAAPDTFYVNVHTSSAADGLARGQLGPTQAREWHTVCLGFLEVPANASAARGSAALRVEANGMLTYVIALSGLAPAAILDAHIHDGPVGVDGGILFDLSPDTATADVAVGTLTQTLPLTDTSLVRVVLEPSAFYVNLHTAAFPGGEVRGQLRTGTAEVWAHLRGDLEVGVFPGNESKRGGATIELETFTSGKAILAVPAVQGIGAVTGAHIHQGLAGVNGPILVDLMAGLDYVTSPATGSAEGSIAFDQAFFARLLANPAGFYVNFHTMAAPNGLVRGQCTQAPQTLVGLLEAANEVPPVLDPGTGKLRVILTGVYTCAYQLEMTAPPVLDVVGLHVHDGAVGVEGPILIDLLGGTATISGNTVLGTSSFTGRTFARLLADAPSFYGNAHTLLHVDGVARGQLLLLTEDSPPAGLIYDSPVIYTTGVQIDDNVPDSIGGAITAYAVAPALPAGLSLDTSTGVISGTPTVVTAETVFTVTASNSAGEVDAFVTITVNEGPPLTLAYVTPVTYVVGTQITPNLAFSTGGAITLYAVLPALPSGLALDPLTGTISGTPLAAAAATDYVVTGSNGAGSTQATVNIQVDATLLAPSGLSYSAPAPTYTTGTAITDNTPTVGGGPVDSYSVTPALPAGLSLDATSGVISGTPTTVTTAADYTVTATNGAGSTQATVNITVNLGAPTNLTYDYNSVVGYVSGGTFTTMTPSSTGGAVTSYSITPALPAGVALNTTTGVISGSPTAQSGQTTYTVTATNAAGNDTAQVSITVLP